MAHDRPRGGYRETLPAGRGGRILKPGEKPKTAFGQPIDPFGMQTRLPGGRQVKRRYADDLSGFRLIPELTCPNLTCGGPLERKFGVAAKGSLVPVHTFRCGLKCGFTLTIKGRVVGMRADGAETMPGERTTVPEMVKGFRVHLDRAQKEGLKEISLVDRLD
jgi:hypothetical protein